MEDCVGIILIALVILFLAGCWLYLYRRTCKTCTSGETYISRSRGADGVTRQTVCCERCHSKRELKPIFPNITFG